MQEIEHFSVLGVFLGNLVSFVKENRPTSLRGMQMCYTIGLNSVMLLDLCSNTDCFNK